MSLLVITKWGVHLKTTWATLYADTVVSNHAWEIILWTWQAALVGEGQQSIVLLCVMFNTTHYSVKVLPANLLRHIGLLVCYWRNYADRSLSYKNLFCYLKVVFVYRVLNYSSSNAEYQSLQGVIYENLGYKQSTWLKFQGLILTYIYTVAVSVELYCSNA